MTARSNLLIDTDPGVDDAMAIFYALDSPEFDVLGLTTIFGNAHTATCTQNALRLLEIAGRADIPVAEGAHRPLAAPFRGPADFVHGTDGQGNVHLPPPAANAVGLPAAQFIVDAVRSRPGELTIVLLGPFTNLAMAMLLHPGLTRDVREIVVMGGAAFCPGNATPAAEANVVNDPEAADIVFGADCPIVMAGLDVTHATHMTNADLARYATLQNPSARHIAAITPFYADFYRHRVGLDGIYVHDSTTISYLLAPQHFEWVELPIRVDCGSSVCRGTTLPALRESDDEGPWAARRPVRILTRVDARAVIELEFERLSAAG